MSSCRRSVLLTQGSRETLGPLAKYSRLGLLTIEAAALSVIVLLWVLNRSNFQIPYVVTVCAYVVFVGGIEAVPKIRSAFERLWLR
jgi:hypothetical protein